MKVIEVINKCGYEAIISYNNSFQTDLLKSRRYNLKITKNNKTYINSNGLTLSGAKIKFEKWLKNNINNGKVKHEKDV